MPDDKQFEEWFEKLTVDLTPAQRRDMSSRLHRLSLRVFEGAIIQELLISQQVLNAFKSASAKANPKPKLPPDQFDRN